MLSTGTVNTTNQNWYFFSSMLMVDK